MSDLSDRSLRWLSSEQVLGDLRRFLLGMKTEHNLTGPWVAAGLHYSGCLAAWLRLKYPHQVAALLSPLRRLYSTPGPRFRYCWRQLSYAMKIQLKAGHFVPFAVPLEHKGAYAWKESVWHKDACNRFFLCLHVM